MNVIQLRREHKKNTLRENALMKRKAKYEMALALIRELEQERPSEYLTASADALKQDFIDWRAERVCG